MAADAAGGRLGLLVGGGPAPGINGVIASVTIEALNQGIEVVGIREGYRWLSQGDADPRHYPLLRMDEVKAVFHKGGALLGTARTNPTRAPEQMAHVLRMLRQLQITALVSIGGDDTGYSASQVYKHAGGEIRVAHVPKTIDNDLPLPGSVPTFGFETARHEGVHIVRSLARDARTTGRWYLVVSMGRAAGHLALGIGTAAAATLTVIPEEFRGRPLPLAELADLVVGSIIKRFGQGANHGVAVLAEGLIEAVGEKGLQESLGERLSRYGDVVRDPHGHLRLGEIEFGRLLKDFVRERLREVGLQVTVVDKDLGYELRSADPIPFDAEYTRNLGYGAVRFLRSKESARYGAVISFVDGRLVPLPFEHIINPETGRMRPRVVDVTGEAYGCARSYMTRLERRDFEEAESLRGLAGVAQMTPERFRERFGYLAGLSPPQG